MPSPKTCARTVGALTLAAAITAAPVVPSAAGPRLAAAYPITISAAREAAKEANAALVQATDSRRKAERAVTERTEQLAAAERNLVAARDRLTRLREMVDAAAADRRLMAGGGGLLDVASEAAEVAADVAGVVAPIIEALDPLADAVDEQTPADDQDVARAEEVERDLRVARAKAVRERRGVADDATGAKTRLDAARVALATAQAAEDSAGAKAAAAADKADMFAASLGIDKRLVQPGLGAVSSPYGIRTHPVTGAHKLHTGIDFQYADGRAYAAADGTVVGVTVDPAFGNLVTIAHGNGITTLYAHLAAALVSPGDTVSAGQVVGQIGSTGLSTGRHLHFEVRVDGKTQDPTNWLGR